MARRRSAEEIQQVLEEFTSKLDFKTVDQIDLETLNSFRSIRSVSARTWTKELGAVLNFFRFCLDNEWVLPELGGEGRHAEESEACRQQAALDVLPLPRGADGPECPYFFWSGHGDRQTFVRDVTRTLSAVFKASGVAKACSHRFRHTLATEVLEMGGTFEDAADILGDTEAIVRKHYAKWSAGRQARITDLLARIWHTKKLSVQAVDVVEEKLVDLVRFAPFATIQSVQVIDFNEMSEAPDVPVRDLRGTFLAQ
jgi:site-specific recombinase XerC